MKLSSTKELVLELAVHPVDEVRAAGAGADANFEWKVPSNNVNLRHW